MDRVSSSMRQVSNPLPKVLGRRAGGMEAERDGFERAQTVSINKAINAQEVAVKEKHPPPCILGTHHEKGAQTFWSVVNRLPLSGNAVLCWKFCHVFHKLLRDGHSNVLKDSLRYKNELSDMSRMWGHLSEGYGQLCSIYLKLLRTKMEFHTKNPRFPGNLQMSDRQLDEAGENDVNNFFQLTVEMFDYLECELNLFQTVFSSLDMSRSVSVTAAGQCRLAPLIQVILDCSHLYDYTVKLLFKLHSCLPADTLQGHRDRFLEQFRKLKDLFYRSSNLQYFKRLIQIPQLPENPPNFLRASALSEHISPVVVIPAEASSPDSEPITDLVEMDTASQSLFDSKFDDIFGSSLGNDPFNFNSQNGMNKDDKDRLIEQLYGEIAALKEELENYKAESARGMMQLRGRTSELEAELAEQQHLKQQAQDESEFLRTELEELKKQREDTEKAQRSLTEIEPMGKESWCSSLCVGQGDAELLCPPQNAEVTKQVTAARQAQGDVEREKKELEDSFQRVSEQAQRKSQEQAEVLDTLKRELAASRQELQVLQGTLESSTQVRAQGDKVLQGHPSSSLPAMLWGPAKHGGDSQPARTGFPVHDPTVVQQESKEQALQQRVAEEQFALLQGTAQEAKRMVQDALSRLEDPAHMACTGSAGGFPGGSPNLALSQPAAVPSPTLCCPLGRRWSRQGWAGAGAGCLSLPAVPSACRAALAGLLEACKQCGSEAVSYLSALQDPGKVKGADCSLLTTCLSRIGTIGQELRPRGLDVKQEELGDLVDKEMAATAAAIETAAARIEEMLSKARAGDTGVKLEVNERILGSCTGLMQAIRVLVLASKDLQREIVESGRGAASPKEFYAKNSRWTEGLISASKAVGWGATVMVDAADLVVQGKGTFEELMVCSREIAASTAQLVAASKVKADKDSANLCKLQQASRGVTQATASVVASTKAGKSQVEEKGNRSSGCCARVQGGHGEHDNLQVRVLELENQLQKERQKLGELRKKHYELAGVAEGWEDGECIPGLPARAEREHSGFFCLSLLFQP
uniref:Huntingtin-interacting protein 1 n=1 Tax=Melopsittacus undulatus TaxID=13146 RepID=A0A8C6NB81_MELUD